MSPARRTRRPSMRRSPTEDDRRATSTVSCLDVYVVGQRTNDAESSPRERPGRSDTPLRRRRNIACLGTGHTDRYDVCTDGHVHVDVVGVGMFERVGDEFTHDQAGICARRRPKIRKADIDEASRCPGG